jgi:hypothetical protein
MTVTEDVPPQLLGFDVRLDQSLYVTELWTAEERAAFLFREEIDWPLSVDWHVWPSYFLHSSVFRAKVDIRPCVAERAIVVDRDDGRYLGLHLWANLETMVACYREQKHDTAPGVVIAVRLEHARSVPHQQLGAVLYPPVSPNAVADGWSFLGYDVADEFMTSALVSGALLPEHRPGLRNSVRPRLNDYGLFSNRRDALEFEAAAHQLSPEFRPFCVYGLYRISA